MRKQEDFSEWYNEIVELAHLTDKRYPIKGMNVWTPYGWKIMRFIDTFIREECDATGHDEVCFPLLIPETEFKKEKDHIKGFDAEVYWVTHAGLNELDVRLLLRPTSETAMYPMFALWVRSHTDLPLKTYQLVNTFRYETKQTRAFIRVREIHFFESHTCHVDEADAQRQVEEDFVILENIMEHLCLPYFLLRRTEWDKFPGAHYTVGVDTLLPDGRSLQLGSIHHYRENFSRPFNITYEDDKGEHRFAHQTTFGMSERLVGAVVAVHGDDKGLVLPPDISPFQVVIVPILAKGNVEKVAEECQKRQGTAGRRLSLSDAFGDGLGSMSCPGNKETGYGHVYGSQFDVGFEKVGIIGLRKVKHRCQLIRGLLVCYEPGAQSKAIRIQYQVTAENGVSESDFQPPIPVGLHRRLLVGLVLHEDHAAFSSLRVILLLKTIGAHIPVKHVDHGVGIDVQDAQSILHGSLAADPGTVGILGHTGPHTLDHDNVFPASDC